MFSNVSQNATQIFAYENVPYVCYVSLSCHTAEPKSSLFSLIDVKYSSSFVVRRSSIDAAQMVVR